MKKYQKRQTVVKSPRPKTPRTLRKQLNASQRRDKQDWNLIERGQMWRQYKDRHA